jgi:hypothetical protein
VSWQPDTALSLSEQLYTPRGSQSIGCGKSITDLVEIDPKSHKDQILATAYQSTEGHEHKEPW